LIGLENAGCRRIVPLQSGPVRRSQTRTARDRLRRILRPHRLLAGMITCCPPYPATAIDLAAPLRPNCGFGAGAAVSLALRARLGARGRLKLQRCVSNSVPSWSGVASRHRGLGRFFAMHRTDRIFSICCGPERQGPQKFVMTVADKDAQPDIPRPRRFGPVPAPPRTSDALRCPRTAIAWACLHLRGWRHGARLGQRLNGFALGILLGWVKRC